MNLGRLRHAVLESQFVVRVVAHRIAYSRLCCEIDTSNDASWKSEDVCNDSASQVRTKSQAMALHSFICGSAQFFRRAIFEAIKFEAALTFTSAQWKTTQDWLHLPTCLVHLLFLHFITSTVQRTTRSGILGFWRGVR